MTDDAPHASLLLYDLLAGAEALTAPFHAGAGLSLASAYWRLIDLRAECVQAVLSLLKDGRKLPAGMTLDPDGSFLFPLTLCNATCPDRARGFVADIMLPAARMRLAPVTAGITDDHSVFLPDYGSITFRLEAEVRAAAARYESGDAGSIKGVVRLRIADAVAWQETARRAGGWPAVTYDPDAGWGLAPAGQNPL